MPEDVSRRLPNGAEPELRLNGRLLSVLRQRRESDLSPVEAAAMIQSLHTLADSLEETRLDRTTDEVLAEVNVDATIEDDNPANVGCEHASRLYPGLGCSAERFPKTRRHTS